MSFLLNTSSAVNVTSVVDDPFDTLKRSAVSVSAMPAGFVPPANATSFSMVLAAAPVLARAIFCPAVVMR